MGTPHMLFGPTGKRSSVYLIPLLPIRVNSRGCSLRTGQIVKNLTGKGGGARKDALKPEASALVCRALRMDT